MSRATRQVTCLVCGKSISAWDAYEKVATVKTDGPAGFGRALVYLCFDHRNEQYGYHSLTEHNHKHG